MNDLLKIQECAAVNDGKRSVGLDLRADKSVTSLYYQIKDARSAARELERQQAMGENLAERPRWDTVEKLCIKALKTKTKDLELASWLVEALLRRQNFAGLATGFTLIKDLITNYWDEIYPLPDEDGLETRLAPLVSLNGNEYEGTLVRPIYHIAITQGNSQEPFALWQYQQAIENGKLTDKTLIEKRRAQGSVFLEQIQIAMQESQPDFYRQLHADLKQARVALTELTELLEAKCGSDAPPASKIAQALNDFEDHLRFILKDAPFGAALLANSTMKTETGTDSTTTPNLTLPKQTNTMPQSLQNRDQALQLIALIAEFFRRTEPQSPLPYMLERAQGLGRLSFPDLLKELVNDEGARNAAYKLMGVASNEKA